MFLTISQNSQKSTLYWNLLFNKAAGLKERPGASNFFKIKLWHKCFTVNFSKFLRTPFLQSISVGCFCPEQLCQSKKHDYYYAFTLWGRDFLRAYKGIISTHRNIEDGELYIISSKWGNLNFLAFWKLIIPHLLYSHGVEVSALPFETVNGNNFYFLSTNLGQV